MCSSINAGLSSPSRTQKGVGTKELNAEITTKKKRIKKLERERDTNAASFALAPANERSPNKCAYTHAPQTAQEQLATFSTLNQQ
jgi:hypothetical protein